METLNVVVRHAGRSPEDREDERAENERTGRGRQNYLAVITKCARRFCCQHVSEDSVQKGRSFP